MIDALLWWTGLAVWGVAGTAALLECALYVLLWIARRAGVLRDFLLWLYARRTGDAPG